MRRPTFFISSTIYDFRDLRGALKYHLERRGCRVLSSEFNDFTKPLNKHSYDACLATIPQADIFILLIGSRVGGWYDSETKISITQQEYRTAYELQKQEKIRILTFVRADIWDYRENLKALIRHLEEMDEIESETAEKITKYKSRFASDGKFIAEFIEEVGKNKETSKAISEKTALPVGNWLHTFSTFAEIAQAIDPLIFNGVDAEEAAARKALEAQLVKLLQESLTKLSQDKVLSLEGALEALRQKVSLQASDFANKISIERKVWDRFVTLITVVFGKNFESKTLQSILASSVLLQYNPRDGSYSSTEAYDALAQLLDEISRFNMGKSKIDIATLLGHGAPATKKRISVSLPAHEFAAGLSLLFRVVNITKLAAALIRALQGADYKNPLLMPRSPFVGMDDELEKETVTVNEALKFAADQVP